MKKDLKNKNASGNNSTDALQILLIFSFVIIYLLFRPNITYFFHFFNKFVDFLFVHSVLSVTSLSSFTLFDFMFIIDLVVN